MSTPPPEISEVYKLYVVLSFQTMGTIVATLSSFYNFYFIRLNFLCSDIFSHNLRGGGGRGGGGKQYCAVIKIKLS